MTDGNARSQILTPLNGATPHRGFLILRFDLKPRVGVLPPGLYPPAYVRRHIGINAVPYAALRVTWASSPRILKMLLKSALAVSTNTPISPITQTE